MQNDAATAKAELLRFAHQQFDLRCKSLSEIEHVIDSEQIKLQLGKLNQALYSIGNNWQGAEFWQIWQQANVSASSKSTGSNNLKPLYPN